ncbi:TauD/TfdA family dioxygenase [Streptomyces thinghirensis]|nr:TauD/TfdA family dioxygenase [Streptomyces thinghirensis]
MVAAPKSSATASGSCTRTGSAPHAKARRSTCTQTASTSSSTSAAYPTGVDTLDEDHVLVQCTRPAPHGGDSFALDAYAFVDGLALDRPRSPRLSHRLGRRSVRRMGGPARAPGEPPDRAARRVHTDRTTHRAPHGRRRTDPPRPRHPTHPHPARPPDRRRAQNRTVAPAFPLDEGDILVLDNYRCWHGRDGHTGERSVRILTARSSDAG